MPPLIRILPDAVVNKIAAGEVVERPSSVVKELVENSIDAGATDITVEIEQAGRRLIRVTDNGSGMPKADARLAFERHATSKIISDHDLNTVRTMGFRGEALSSIASVSQVRMVTAEPGSNSGVAVEIEAGTVRAVMDAAAAPGTSLEINHLFFNTPARLKFLKSPATEFSHIVAAFSRLALAHSAVRFRLTHNKKVVLDLPSSQVPRQRIHQLYGAEVAGNLVEFSAARDSVRLQGLLGRPGYTRADKTYQDFYVNSRAVRNASLTHALYAAYNDLLMRDRHPLAFIFLDIDPALVDVNVHPAKAEVRFRSQAQVHDLLRDAVREGLRGAASTSVSVPPREGGVEEAVSAYLRGAERGTPSGAYRTPPLSDGLFPAKGDNNGPPAEGLLERSALDTPHSALFHPLTQIHDSFIVAQSSEGMALIDQHAAHERILFEKLQDQQAAGDVAQQNLLLPVPIELGHADMALLSDHLSELRSLGFLVEDFGRGTFVIKAVPALLAGGDYKQLVLDILDEVKAHGTSSRIANLRDEVLSVMACHPAIKVHRRLSLREMEDLLRDLFSCRMPHSCPHGRPTVVRFSIDEIKKMFKRI